MAVDRCKRDDSPEATTSIQARPPLRGIFLTLKISERAIDPMKVGHIPYELAMLIPALMEDPYDKEEIEQRAQSVGIRWTGAGETGGDSHPSSRTWPWRAETSSVRLVIFALATFSFSWAISRFVFGLPVSYLHGY
jgi:hypothetical protein